MTLAKIQQITSIVLKLDNLPKNLKLCNAYIDQALMNFNYETMPKAEQKKCLMLIPLMIDKFNLIRGR